MPETQEKQKDAIAHEAVWQRKEAELSAREACFAERETQLQKAEAKLCLQRTTDFVNALIKEGRLLPRHRDEMIAFIGRLDETEIKESTESDDAKETEEKTVKNQAMDFFQKFLSNLPIQVEYSEKTAGIERETETIRFGTPDGFEVDPIGMASHRKILAYAHANNTDYTTAALAVSND